MNDINCQEYWNRRAKHSYTYRGETFYTVTPIPYYYKRRSLLLSYINQYVEDNSVKKILDFGCGDGEYLKYFGNKYPNKDYYGIDISTSMIERAKASAPFAKLCISNDGISFKNNFDLIYSIAVFAHIQDELIFPLFSNIYKHLNPFGKFILFEQTGSKRSDGDIWHRRTTQEYMQVATRCGFKIEQRHLITFTAHRFFEIKIHPFIISLLRLLMIGHDNHERCIIANKLMMFRALSKMFLSISSLPVRNDDGRRDGNTLYIMKKD